MGDLLTPIASTTEKGLVELATDSETTAGLAVQASDFRLNPHFGSPTLQGEILISNSYDTVGTTESSATIATGAFALTDGTPSIGIVFSASIAEDATHGYYGQFDTTTTTGNSKGLDTVYKQVRRKYNPKLFFKFQIPTTTTVRVFIGFVSGIPTYTLGDDYLNAKSGFGLYVTSGGAFRVGSNDGSGVTAFTASLAAIDANPHTLYIEADEAGGRWGYSFDGAATTYITTDTPASTTQMAFVFGVQTNTAAIRSLRIYNVKFKETWA